MPGTVTVTISKARTLATQRTIQFFISNTPEWSVKGAWFSAGWTLQRKGKFHCRKSGEDESLDGAGNPIVSNAGGHPVGGGLNLRLGVAHRHTDSGPAKHLQIVEMVADGQDLLAVHVQTRSDGLQPDLLVDIGDENLYAPVALGTGLDDGDIRRQLFLQVAHQRTNPMRRPEGGDGDRLKRQVFQESRMRAVAG